MTCIFVIRKLIYIAMISYSRQKLLLNRHRLYYWTHHSCCVFIFYADHQSNIIHSPVNDSVDTNLASHRNYQPASSGDRSEFRTPTAKLCPTKKAIQGKYVHLIPGVVCSLTLHNMLFPNFVLNLTSD